MAELADAHGSGPCDSNIMRVQVPSSARRLKSKDLSLFSFHTNNLAMRGAQRAPRHRLAFANLISPSTPFLFLSSSRQCTAHLRPEAHRRVTPTTMNNLPKSTKNLPSRSLRQKGFLFSPAIKPVLFLLTQQALQSPLRR